MHSSDRSSLLLALLLPFPLLLAGPGIAQTGPGEKRPPVVDPPAGPLGNPTAPPPGPVHCVAEWEEAEGVLIRWKNADLIREIQRDSLAYIPVNDRAQHLDWINWLNNHSIPLTNIRFLPIPTNSIYTRDYGPWFVWDANNELGIVDYKPSYGYWDDLFPLNFANHFGIAYYDSGLNHVGGNYLPIGYDVAFSSTHVYEQNANSTRADVDRAMESFYGINPYRTVAPKTIWHHDTWGKPCTPDTLIVVDFPASAPFKRRQANDTVDFYATLESPWGRPYKILRLPMFYKSGSYFRPYMNSLVSNKKVFVPADGHPDDLVAESVFREAFPGWEIVLVDSQGCAHFDAVHCRTRNFVRRDPLRLYPYPPGDTEDTTSGYTLEVEAIPPNGFTLLAGNPVVHWSETGKPPFQQLAMTPTGVPDRYRATLPPRPRGTTISYYVEAQDDGGRTAIYPPVAPLGLLSFTVREDDVAPELSRLLPARSGSLAHWPPSVRVLAKDDMTTPEVRLEYAVNGQQQPDLLLQRGRQCYWYDGSPAGNPASGDLITYRIVASDLAANANETQLPLFGQIHCPVFATTDVAVVNMSRRPVTAPFLVAALGDLGIPYTFYDEWPSDWSTHDVWLVCLGVFADNHVLSPSQALDVTQALANGKSIYLEGGDTWCYDPQRVVLTPWFGVQEVSRGSSLSSVQGETGSILEGLSLSYVTENLLLDQIAAAPNGRLLSTSHSGNRGRGVVSAGGSTARSPAPTPSVAWWTPPGRRRARRSSCATSSTSESIRSS